MSVSLDKIVNLKTELNLRQISELRSLASNLSGLTILPSPFLPARGMALYVGEDLYGELLREIKGYDR